MQQINEWKAAAILGFIPDDENPLFLFNRATKEMLVEILSGGINVVELVKFELRSRGLNEEGRFVGFN
ncbi:MAG: hypothetical protein BGO70_03685 [Bacteroidetes bacterium 43-93]|nr:MAG: hypothetical protein BGO70_03685 [Bacteroidetes bacterium 43-93]